MDEARALAEEIRSVMIDVLDKGPEEQRGTWQAVAEAGLLAMAAPEAFGGSDLGLREVGVLLEEAGRRASDLPLWETLVCGQLTIAEHASEDLKADLLPRLVAGEVMISPAIAEPGAALAREPKTTFDGKLLNGHKIGLRRYDADSLLIVTASSAEGPVVVLVDPGAEGVDFQQASNSRGNNAATVTFSHAAVVAVLDGGAIDTLLRNASAGLVLWGDGLLAGACDLTAGYIKERRQFGRSLAEFQAVAMQMADVYVDSRMVSLAADEVARRISAGQPVSDDLAVASYWFCEKAPRALQTCHHLHGGFGVDETYELPAYFASVKDITVALGGVEATLAQVPVAEGAEKNLELTEEQRAFKAEVREYFHGLVSDEQRLEMMTDRHGKAYHDTIKKMGRDGWMGVGWPTEYGGKGMGGMEQQIFANEASHADVHLPSVTLQTVGPTLQAFGTEKQKDMFLKDILAGDVHFAIGYSEPDAGTDLASLRTSAKRDGDHYVVNGQKMWTTGGHAADYVWLAVRTDPDAPKHKGISVLIMDTKDPGYSHTPIITSDGSHHVNATYYNDVRVPVDMLVGKENEGWKLITTQLNHERVMLGPAGRIEGLRDMVVEWARDKTTASGGAVLDEPAVQAILGYATAAYRVNELLNWQVAGSGATGPEAVADSSASKVFASHEIQRIGIDLERIVTTYGDPADPDTAKLLHYLDATSKRNLVLTFGGGVNEVQRELICMFGLNLPKVPR
jgi:alkylation response protein AidB-like acyl-CoA dehydrogenase